MRKLTLLIASFLFTLTAVAADSPAERAAKSVTVSELRGHKILHITGTDMGERGFAQGYLFAKETLGELESAIQSLPGVTADNYNNQFIPWAVANFKWDADAVAEIDGVFAGIAERLGAEGMRSKVLGRAVTREDVMAINALADYFGPACSAFAAWGDRTVDGKVIHGRTLDFPIGAEAVAGQFLIVSDALPDRGADKPARKAFVAVGWPGMVTQYTGMNADGLVVCIHDGYNLHERTRRGSEKTERCFPRGLMIRRILESVDPAAGDPAAAAAKLIAAHATACGNLFHLSWPNAAAKKTGTLPSAVLEFGPANRNPSIRRPDLANAMVLTNHFCVLNTPIACERCEHITKGLSLLETAQMRIGIPDARKLLKTAEQPVAAHSVYFLPDTLEFHVALTRRNIMSPSVVPTRFTFAELFEKK